MELLLYIYAQSDDGMAQKLENTGRVALLVLGCPEVPVQTSIALYLMNLLKHHGIRPVIAGTKSARMLLEVADIERHYLGDLLDLDHCIAEIVEKRMDADLCFVFIHKESGISYAATMSSISRAKIIALIFGEEAHELAGQITFPCEKIVARAAHNPTPLRGKLDELAGGW